MPTTPRRVLLAEPRGSCAGVRRAVDIVERALEIHGAPVYVRKQIVHNAYVVGRLEELGARFVESEDEVPEGAVCVFSAHGVSPRVRENAARRELTVVDATCPLVAKVHQEARRFARDHHTLILIGHADHEEIEGTYGEAPERTVIVEDVEGARRLELAPGTSAAYLTQTTLSVDDTAEIVAVLRERFPSLAGPAGNDICYASQNRQNAVKAIAGRSDLVLVVGSPNSSNSVRMVEVAESTGTPSRLLPDAGHLDPGWLSDVRTLGLSAGASVPDVLVEQVLDRLSALGFTAVETEVTATEDVVFRVPSGLERVGGGRELEAGREADGEAAGREEDEGAAAGPDGTRSQPPARPERGLDADGTTAARRAPAQPTRGLDADDTTAARDAREEAAAKPNGTRSQPPAQPERGLDTDDTTAAQQPPAQPARRLNADDTTAAQQPPAQPTRAARPLSEPTPRAPADAALTRLLARASARIDDLLSAEASRWGAVDARVAVPVEAIAELVSAGGKRLRPAFCVSGYLAAGGTARTPDEDAVVARTGGTAREPGEDAVVDTAGGTAARWAAPEAAEVSAARAVSPRSLTTAGGTAREPGDDAVVAAAAGLELLHAFALLHDDVMDNSPTRRGVPTVHAKHAALHAARGWAGEHRRFGEGVGILAGDLALGYAGRLVAGLPDPAKEIWTDLVNEMIIGQYLDIALAAEFVPDAALARWVAVCKSGRYTIHRPLALGAALAGRPDLYAVFERYGVAAGEAFQLRDDLLDAFGDAAATGKPAGLDVSEHKMTLLLALAADRDPEVARLVDASRAGAWNPAALLTALHASGVRQEVEQQISHLVTASHAALEGAPLADGWRKRLARMAEGVAYRDR